MVIVLVIVGGIVFMFMYFDLICVFYWSVVINGVSVVLIMVVMMLMVRSKCVMGEFVVRGVFVWGGWIVMFVMVIVVMGVFVLG